MRSGVSHIVIANITAAARGIEASHVLLDETEPASEVKLLVWKTYWKLMSELLAQLSGVTFGTSSGSAKVISTHCRFPCQRYSPSSLGISQLTL